MRVKWLKVTYKRVLRGINAKILWHYCHLVTLLYYSYLLLEDDRMIYIYVKCIIRECISRVPYRENTQYYVISVIRSPGVYFGDGLGSMKMQLRKKHLGRI